MEALSFIFWLDRKNNKEARWIDRKEWPRVYSILGNTYLLKKDSEEMSQTEMGKLAVEDVLNNKRSN